MHDRDHQCSRPHARERPVVGTTAASQPVAIAIGCHRGHQHHVSLLDGHRYFASIDPKFQIPIRKHPRQQHFNAAHPQSLQRLAHVGLTTQRRIAGDDASVGDLGDREQRTAALPVAFGIGDAGGQQRRSQRGLRRLEAHA